MKVWGAPLLAVVVLLSGCADRKAREDISVLKEEDTELWRAVRAMQADNAPWAQGAAGEAFTVDNRVAKLDAAQAGSVWRGAVEFTCIAGGARSAGISDVVANVPATGNMVAKLTPEAGPLALWARKESDGAGLYAQGTGCWVRALRAFRTAGG